MYVYTILIHIPMCKSWCLVFPTKPGQALAGRRPVPTPATLNASRMPLLERRNILGLARPLPCAPV